MDNDRIVTSLLTAWVVVASAGMTASFAGAVAGWLGAPHPLDVAFEVGAGFLGLVGALIFVSSMIARTDAGRDQTRGSK